MIYVAFIEKKGKVLYCDYTFTYFFKLLFNAFGVSPFLKYTAIYHYT